MKYKLINSPDMDILTTVLKNRNIDNLDSLLNPNAERTNPFKFKMMKQGIEMLSNCVRDKALIGILVDTDCDGYTSSALIYNFIKDILGYPNIKILFHDKDKAHGLTPNIVNKILSEKIELIICPDSSSSDLTSQQKLTTNGVNVLILDHHEFDEYFCHNNIVIINNQESNIVNNSFAGVGVTYEFVIAYCKQKNIQLPKYKYLDLVAIGNIADVMDLRNIENRMLCKSGLENIENKYLKTILNKKEIEIPTIIDIAFNVAPEINAIIRMGTKEDKLKLFHVLTNKEYLVPYKPRGKSETMIPISEEVLRLSSSLRNKQRTSVKKAVEEVKDEIEKLNNKNVLMVEIDTSTPYALTGLIANQLAKQNKKNCIVLRKSVENPSTYTGSARAYSNMDFKEVCTNTNLFNFCAGHAGSFGISLDIDKLESTIDALHIALDGTTSQKLYEVDYIIDSKDLTYSDIQSIASLKHLWGNGIQEPIFAITNIKMPYSEVKQIARATVGFKYNKLNYVKTFAPTGFLEEISCKAHVKFKPINIQLNMICKFVDTKYGSQIQIIDFESKPYEEVLW